MADKTGIQTFHTGHTHIHTYLHTYIHTGIHTHRQHIIHAHRQTGRHRQSDRANRTHMTYRRLTQTNIYARSYRQV